MAEAVILIKPGEMLKARLNQPRVSLEYLRQQEIRHRQASEEFSKAVRSGTLKPGVVNGPSGETA
jgi:hypothetical protein